MIILKDVRCRCRHTFFVSRAETQFFNSILCGLKEFNVIYFRCSLSQRLKCKNSAIFFAIIPSVAINLCVHKLLYVLGANDFSDFSNCGFIPICIFFPILIFAWKHLPKINRFTNSEKRFLLRRSQWNVNSIWLL